MTTPTTWLRESTIPLSEAYQIALLDLDGVCYKGSEPVEYAAAGIADARKRGMRAMLVTNNANRPPQVVADQLTSLDIPTKNDEILTAAQAGVAILAEHVPAGSVVLSVGGAGLTEALTEGGFKVTDTADDKPAAVIQGFNPEVGWRQLSEAALAIQAGAFFVATNLDSTLPLERGQHLGNGSLVAAVVNATGVTPVSGGKPQAEIFHFAIKKAGGGTALAIGDRLNTDLAGGRAANVPGLHVLTGVSDARDVVLAIPEERPDFLAVDMRGLNRPHPGADIRLDSDAATARVRGAVAIASAQGLVLDGEKLDGEKQTVTLDQYRALAAAAWAAADLGCPVPEAQVPELSVLPEE